MICTHENVTFHRNITQPSRDLVLTVTINQGHIVSLFLRRLNIFQGSGNITCDGTYHLSENSARCPFLVRRTFWIHSYRGKGSPHLPEPKPSSQARSLERYPHARSSHLDRFINCSNVEPNSSFCVSHSPGDCCSGAGYQQCAEPSEPDCLPASSCQSSVLMHCDAYPAPFLSSPRGIKKFCI
jgi:hypothetical protein